MNTIKQRIEDQETQIWFSELQNDTGRKGSQRNTLRAYRIFKKKIQTGEIPNRSQQYQTSNKFN